MALAIVRLGSPRTRGEGTRLGTVRRPPRGVPRRDFARRDFYDVWLPELSPSAALMQTVDRDDPRWQRLDLPAHLFAIDFSDFEQEINQLRTYQGQSDVYTINAKGTILAPTFGGGANGSAPSLQAVYEVFQSEFDVAYEERGLYLLTMHPHITGHRSRVAMLDRLIQHMKSKPGVWFATHEQIARHVKPLM